MAGLGNDPALPLNARGASNLAALARLIGLVRYFHPSDASAGLDWPAWTINAVERWKALGMPPSSPGSSASSWRVGLR